MRTIENVNVCVIGGAGFLGSHLVDHLINDRNCSVVVLDNLITGLKKHIHEKAKFMWFDIRDDENQLAKLLKENKIGGAALDVFRNEPIDKKHVFTKMENVVLVPHIGSSSKETREKMAEITMMNLKLGLDRKKLLYSV